jgi:nitrite reductase (NADH) small subunit
VEREFRPVGRVSEFVSRQGTMVTVDGRHVAVFRLGDEFFAIDNLCLHKAGPLCEGEIDAKDVVTCPWHGWSYDIRTGALTQDPRVGVSRHDVRVDGDVVSVRLTD